MQIKNSGTVNSPITIANYPDEKPIITGTNLKPAMIINDQSYLIFDGLTVDNVNRWLYALNVDHITFQNNNFSRAIDPGHSQKACLFFQEATHVKILNNIIHDCAEDNLALIKSDYNLVEGNDIRKGVHVLWAIKCGNNNIIRNNYFHNELEKIGEIFDCHDVGFDHEFNNIVNATKHNLIEKNEFAYVPAHIDRSPYSGIQFAAQECIIRNNVYYDHEGPGIVFTLYNSAEANYNLKNRVYNNVFYNNGLGGIAIADSTQYTMYDNIFKNNIFYKNTFKAHDDRWTWYQNLDGKPVQLLISNVGKFIFENNNLFNNEPDETFLITNGSRDHSINPSQYSVSYWNSNSPDFFIGNKNIDPQFVSANNKDFNFKETSPMVDSGTYLTKTKSAGSGKDMPVEDVLYFFDGFGIENELGDLIQLEGSTEISRIVDIDYQNNILKLNNALTWNSNQGVFLTYSGNGPDLGAFESDGEQHVFVCTDADTNNNGIVSNSELLVSINSWKNGDLTIKDLFDIINIWKNGCN